MISEHIRAVLLDLKARQSAGEHMPCPRCGTVIDRIVVAQRGTHLCPRCQKRP